MHASFQPKDPAYETRVRESFARQTFMQTLGAELRTVEPGFVEIALPCREALVQQHGFVHAGAVASVVDSACGYAAFSLMPPGAGVLSVEFKVNLMAPAAGPSILATGRVTRPGRTITVCQGDAYTLNGDTQKHIATMLATMMTIEGRGIVD